MFLLMNYIKTFALLRLQCLCVRAEPIFYNVFQDFRNMAEQFAENGGVMTDADFEMALDALREQEQASHVGELLSKFILLFLVDA